MRTFIAGFAWAPVALLAIACSGSPSGGFTPSGGGSADDDGGGSASSSSGGGASSGALGSSSGGLVSEDSGAGSCKTGVYNGTFSCYFYYGSDAGLGDLPDSGGLGPITGTMSFMLTQNVTTTGELLSTDTASGTFAAATGGFIAADANLTGTLQCAQGTFSGELEDGVYGFSLSMNTAPLPDPNNKFMGPLASDYDTTTSTFTNGTWSMYIANEGTCGGTWTATYAGPGDGGAGPVDAGGQ